jgi:hypothetical protein
MIVHEMVDKKQKQWKGKKKVGGKREREREEEEEDKLPAELLSKYDMVQI